VTLYLAALAVLAAGGLAALAAASRPSLALGLDPLSAVFATAVFGLGLAAAVFGAGHLRGHLGRRSLGPFLLFFDLLLATMGLLLAARQALLFLAAWEAMSLASFFLVAFEHQDRSVRDAARTYLVASHLGTAFLFALFLLLGQGAGSLRFEAFAQAAASASPTLLFALALVGFGTKAGLVPLHVWLPEAHPAAPSHVSALMSAVLVKMGLYGILRVLGFLPPLPAAHGLLLAGIGPAGALIALLLALGQRDLKRVLAYSTVENVGLVALGLGVGLAGAALGSPSVAALGVAGALLHVWNHALMKGLAFLAAGAIVHGAGTRDLEAMGGRRLPFSGAALLLAGGALAALPPLNGFASEWLLYLGLAEGGRGAGAGLGLAAFLALAVLALVGGLAAVVFTRAAGIALLGEPRGAAAAAAHEGGPLLLAPVGALAAGCVAVAAFPAETVALLAPAAAQVLRVPAAGVAASLAPAAASLAGPMRIALALLAASAAALALASRASRGASRSATWGCGFAAPSARMQVTAASHARLALESAAPGVLRPRAARETPAGPFSGAGRLALDGADPGRTRLFEPAFRAAADRFARLRGLQHGRLNLQLLYTVLALLALGALVLLHRRFP
jgi:formate hydrogenlyase subunit 3/multisubunit Na+/H+ antiporter MnhD subunit